MRQAQRLTGLHDLRPDMQNANKGTERGRGMLENSLRETGAGRSILVDKNGMVISGNKTLEVWSELSEAIRVVPTDGQTLVVVQREDLDLTDPQNPARKLAYYDNRVSEVNLAWHMDQIAADMQRNVDLTHLWSGVELEKMTRPAFLPNTAPTMGHREVTSADIARTAGHMGTRYQAGTETTAGLVEIICPHCTQTFYVQKGDVT